jgi:hypothetical protein
VEIDLSATKRALTATGRTLNGWARCAGLKEGTVASFFCGAFVTNGPVYHGIVDALEKDGFLRFKEAA